MSASEELGHLLNGVVTVPDSISNDALEAVETLKMAADAAKDMEASWAERTALIMVMYFICRDGLTYERAVEVARDFDPDDLVAQAMGWVEDGCPKDDEET